MTTLARPLAPAAVAVLAAAALGCAGARGRAPAAATHVRTWPVPGHGALVVHVPRGWRERPDAGGPTTVELAPPDRSFLVLVTPFLNPGDEPPGRKGDTARLFVELARRKALSTSVEEELAIRELEGEHGVRGAWFEATDRAMAGREPQPDEYRHLLQGAAAVGDLLVAFTVLDNGDGPHRAEALRLVGGARHVPGEDGAEAEDGEGGPDDLDAPGEPGDREPADGLDGAFQPDPGAETVPLVVSTPDGAVSVLVYLPGFRMFRPRTGEDGESVMVLGQHPETDLVASVILRRAPGLDAAGCRDAALERIERSTAVEGVARTGTAERARLAYALREVSGLPIRQVHAHVFLARDDVCVNVHVSKADPVKEDALRIEEILSSVGFADAM